MTEFYDGMSLGEARALLRSLVDEGGHRCPCCTQWAKVYRRPLSAASAAALIVLYRQAGENWAHIPTLMAERLPRLANQGGQLLLGQHWGLLKEREGHVGVWRVTERGVSFVNGGERIHKYARLYDGRCLGWAGPQVSIRDALSTKFDYEELMSR